MTSMNVEDLRCIKLVVLLHYLDNHWELFSLVDPEALDCCFVKPPSLVERELEKEGVGALRLVRIHCVGSPTERRERKVVVERRTIL